MTSGKQIFAYGQEMFGNGSVIFQWSQDFQYIACLGQNNNIIVLDKRGKKLKELQNPVKASIKNLDWDKDNEYLGVLYENQNFIMLWNVFAQGIQTQQMEVDNQKFKATFMKWSRSHSVLAIGTDKGSLIFYNKISQKKVPTMGKHAKRIVTGDWNEDGLLITGGEDKILTVSNYTSESKTESMSLNHEPRLVKWTRQKTDERTSQNKTITAILQNKSLLMFQYENKKQPLELFFESKYGKIVDYQLFGDGYVVIAFSEGYISHISSHMNEVKDEVSSEQIFQSCITAIATNDILYKLAVSSEHSIKMVDLSNWKVITNETIELPVQAGKILSLGWSQNGQTLLVSTQNGGLFGFMTNVPLILSEYQNNVALLTSFKEVSIVDLNNKQQQQQQQALATIALECEPQLITLGAYYLATCMNNITWFYKLEQGDQSQLVQKKEYDGKILKIIIQNSYVVVFTNKRAILHSIDGKQQFEKRFPEQQSEKNLNATGENIIHGTLTSNFLILLYQNYRIKYYNIQDQQITMEYQSEYKLQRIYSNQNGTKCVCIDNIGKGYLFLAAQEQLIVIQGFPQKCDQILWDSQDSLCFCVIENQSIYTFMIQQNSLTGCQVQCVKILLSIEELDQDNKVCLTTLDKKVKGISLNNGYLNCMAQDGSMYGQLLVSHNLQSVYKYDDETSENHYRYFLQSLMLNRFKQCLFPASKLKSDELYEVIGKRCLQSLDLETALLSFQKSNNVSMVMTVKQIFQENEKNVLNGHVAMILGQYDLAMDLYLKSSQPSLALDMRCDIQDWIIALNLAKTIDPQQEPIICKKLGQQLESQGNFNESQRLYEKAILQTKNDQNNTNNDNEFEDNNHIQQNQNINVEEHNVQCFAGIARTSIKLGDVNRGFQLANQLGESNIQHLIEIALVCENQKQTFEAAQLYQKAGMNEKSASLYIQLKMFDFATPLISKIKSPKLLSQLAKSKEIEGNYMEAEKAYEKAENWENVIRLNLNQLDNLEKAKQVLREKCPTDTCANMVASACQSKGLKRDAIEFLLLANKKDEAFALAQSSSEMQVYVDNLKQFIGDDRLKVAQYFEGKSIYNEAAKHYELIGNYIKALSLYKKGGEQYLDECIDMIGRVKNDNLTLSLLAYIMGEDDGIPKDPHYAYKVYRVLEKYTEAGRIALTIWGQEMERGNYQQAHYYLYDIYRDLKSFNMQVPFEIHQKLMILHSYMIVKRVIKLGHQEDAVQLLNRVCKNISQFQQHAVNILTYTVIQSTKAKLKDIAYIWSHTLCRQEYRSQINEKYRKNIENIARKPVQEQPQNVQTPCPFCSNQVEQFELFCDRCQQNIPFCIATGKHVIKEQLCVCENCEFPAIYENFKMMMEDENNCPMCQRPINLSNLKVNQDLVHSLKHQKSQNE